MALRSCRLKLLLSPPGDENGFTAAAHRSRSKVAARPAVFSWRERVSKIRIRFNSRLPNRTRGILEIVNATLLIATRNAHKVGEIRTILGAEFAYRTLKDFPTAPETIEDAPDFAGNARKKALGLAEWLRGNPVSHGQKILVLADDSGLEVDALNGAPGVYSARFAALDTGKVGNSPDAENNAKLLRLLQAVPSERRVARFRCVLALAILENGVVSEAPTFAGACEGYIALGSSGSGGFGYDPLFIPNGYDRSFAELGDEVKNQLSHRAQALQALRQWLARPPRSATP